ncbi:MAG: hypothetical protein M0Z90_01595, partial [Desulfobacteraceae bacterium]|nr:hypothetical protein [Desulfobacteraceae bacterium]
RELKMKDGDGAIATMYHQAITAHIQHYMPVSLSGVGSVIFLPDRQFNACANQPTHLFCR